MPKLINQDNYGTAIVDKNGAPTQAFYQLISLLTDLEILDGTGSPEGVYKGTLKKLYLDTAASKLYVKTTDFGDDTGWQILN